MTCSHCCGSGIEPSVLTLDVAFPCGICEGKGVYPPEWWRDVSRCAGNVTAAALGAAGERSEG
jgi:DnaJ-class molecular chaperone